MLDAAQKRKNYNNKQRETYASGRNVTPAAAVRPARQSAEESQDQEDHEDSSEHGCFSFSKFNRTAAQRS